MPEFLSSKVAITEDDQQARSRVGSGSAAIAGILGIAERGPIGQPVLCTSPEEYATRFGGYVQGSDLRQNVELFFENGGRVLHVVRVAHFSNIEDRGAVTAKSSEATLVSDTNVIATVRAKELGTSGDGLRVEFEPHQKGLDVTISRGAKHVGHWVNLSTDPSHVNHYARFLTDASPVDVAIKDAAVTVAPQRQTLLLSGGDDGLAGLTDQDYLGDGRSKLGLRAFDSVLGLSLLAIPGASANVQRGLMSYCERVRRGRVFPVLDLPASMGAEAAARYVDEERLLEATEHGAVYWPRVLVASPVARSTEAKKMAVSPCGAVMGVIARNAASRPGGVYIPPAGIDAGRLHGVVGFDNDECLDEDRRDIVYPSRINPLTTGHGLPYFVDGSRTLKSTGNCPWVAHRRGMSNIERDLERRLQYIRHKPITGALLAGAYRDTTSYLLEQMRDGAFASQDPKTAFHVEPPFVSRNATVEVPVGLAFAEPAEFVWLHLSVQTGNAPAAQGGK